MSHCGCHTGEGDHCGSDHSTEIGHHTIGGLYEGEDYACKLIEFAEFAWKAILIEKIKEHINRNQGKNLDELAALIAEASQEKWTKKLAAKHCKECFEGKLREFFSKACAAHSKQGGVK